MIPIRSIVISAVLLLKIDGEIKLLMMKRVKGNFWCHITEKIESNENAYHAIVREIYEKTLVNVRDLYNADYMT